MVQEVNVCAKKLSFINQKTHKEVPEKVSFYANKQNLKVTQPLS